MALNPVSGSSNTFNHALTNTDLPQGFTLLQDNETTYTCSQYWQTPNDTQFALIYNGSSNYPPNGSVSMTYYFNRVWLEIKKYNTTPDAVLTWSYIEQGVGTTPFSFKGADEGLNVTLNPFFGSTYYAKKGNDIIDIYGLANFSDVNILMEAQLSQLSTRSAPGFTFSLVLVSFGLLALVLSRKKN